MTQEPLFRDLLADRLAAIGADVDAIGTKQVCKHLWPDMAPETAQRKISNNLNPNQKHEFSDNEVWKIKTLARLNAGRSHILEFEARELTADLHWVTQEEQLDRKERAIEALLDKVHTELQEWKEARRTLK